MTIHIQKDAHAGNKPTFSRGMQQRLAIGRAVLYDPEVILFDEPHTGLDQDASEMLDKALNQVASAAGRSNNDFARPGQGG